MKVLSVPHLDQLGSGESGIHTVIRAYFRHAPEFDIEFVPPGTDSFDVLAVHAGMSGAYPKGGPTVAHTHGLYWTADYEMGSWAYFANKNVIDSIRYAKAVTVPSRWVAETFQRDMRINPYVIPHGIDWDRWQHNRERRPFVIGYAKNRAGIDVCNPSFLPGLAARFPELPFVATFSPGDVDNITKTGVLPHDKMKELVQQASVYINTTKETWGIGMLEAMAAGVPVLAFAHGGAKELVRHGVTGYLAAPDDYDDLANGLIYCLKYLDILGENARTYARQYTWPLAMKKLREVYVNVAEHDPPTVAIIIPVYNKPEEEVSRAIQSAKNQTLQPTEIIVVDDGSDNGDAYRDMAEREGAIFLRQDNRGVAYARNAGIRYTQCKYVVCLDSDDWLAPEFLEACVPELEADNSLGIAYTGLHYHKPDGEEGLSSWPEDFDYDKQIKGQNQIPTACVFRRAAWQRVGGYHQRYAPLGAGEEDANLWLRIPSVGYNAKKVTTAGLFHYSWQSGYVSGNKSHRVTDWRYWLPWTRDGQHPFASVARPAKQSHAVRQYDEPAVSVIIPVGQGHEDIVFNALDSLEAQEFRKWEAIVVYDTPTIYWKMTRSYPYVRTLSVYDLGGEGARGAGYARNRGVEIARAPFLLFLDADDQLHPEALSKMLNAYGATGAAIYTDYIGKAAVDDPSKLAVELQDNMLEYDEETKVAVIKHHSSNFDPRRANDQPQNPPYIWNNITTLVPKVWHDEIGGFDEEMESWEDVDYWWRMAWIGKSFHRIEEPLLVYRFSTGSRRARGLKDWDNLLRYLNAKKRGMRHAV